MSNCCFKITKLYWKLYLILFVKYFLFLSYKIVFGKSGSEERKQVRGSYIDAYKCCM